VAEEFFDGDQRDAALDEQGRAAVSEVVEADAADGDVEAMVAAKDALDNMMRRASPQIAELTMQFHQMRIRGVLLGPEVKRDTKDGNCPRSHLPTTPGPDSNIEGSWPTRDEQPEDDA
jgi:hypothetical protein